MNNEEVEFLDAPVINNTNINQDANNIVNGQPINNQPSVSDPIVSPIMDKPTTQQVEPQPEPTHQPKMMINPANNTISSPTKTDNNMDLLDDNELVGKMDPSLTDFKDVEIVKDSSLIKPSIYMFLIFGLIEFIIGPRVVVKYTVQYGTQLLSKFLTNDLNGVRFYLIIMGILVIGLLTYFFIMFVYSIINLAVKGEYYDKLKSSIKSMLGYSFIFASVIMLLLAIFKIDLATPVIKLVTFNGLLFKYYYI